MSGSSKLIPVVLIVGDRDVGKCTLASRILKKELSHTEQLREHAFTWELDTKYYKASILLKYEQIGATCQTRVQPPIEGLILLLDGFRQETWNAAREWMSAFEQDPAVRLCVINKCEQCLASSPRPAWHEEVREWCLAWTQRRTVPSATTWVRASLEWWRLSRRTSGRACAGRGGSPQTALPPRPAPRAMAAAMQSRRGAQARAPVHAKREAPSPRFALLWRRRRRRSLPPGLWTPGGTPSLTGSLGSSASSCSA
uniref:Uncharacterized protein n=1 Tax=Tetraselmis sp. GSL018 TaxID=582737 RepID=A0A061R0R1_9CHLO